MSDLGQEGIRRYLHDYTADYEDGHCCRVLCRRCVGTSRAGHFGRNNVVLITL
jgi:hypothetical protein